MNFAPLDLRAAREELLLRLRAEGIHDERVLSALRDVPRHQLVPQELRERAYENRPLPIGGGQTISQPYIVGLMTQLAELSPEDRVLEIGTGSGYQTAVLGKLAGEVYTIEIVAPLAERARQVLEQLGLSDNVHFRVGDGYTGWPEKAPFDVILVTAAPASVPPPLHAQLKMGGRLVIPVGDVDQELHVLEKTETGLVSRELVPVRFVPMTGQAMQGGF